MYYSRNIIQTYNIKKAVSAWAETARVYEDYRLAKQIFVSVLDDDATVVGIYLATDDVVHKCLCIQYWMHILYIGRGTYPNSVYSTFVANRQGGQRTTTLSVVYNKIVVLLHSCTGDGIYFISAEDIDLSVMKNLNS